MEASEAGFFRKGRVEAFSDGVFAIIVTLLVLELHVPALPSEQHGSAAALAGALLALLPKFASWVVSFFVVCVAWANHHQVLGVFQRLDAGAFWLNAHLLLWLTLIPFPTALLGDYFHNPLAASLFGLVLALGALAFAGLRLYAARRPQLLMPGLDLPAYQRATRRALVVGPLAYLLGATLAWAWPPAALLVYTLVPAYFSTRATA